MKSINHSSDRLIKQKGKKKKTPSQVGQMEKRQLHIINQFGLIDSSGKPFSPHGHDHGTEEKTGATEQRTAVLNLSE